MTATATEVEPDLVKDEDDGITEITDFDVTRVDAVRSPANGGRWLVMKALSPEAERAEVHPMRDAKTGTAGCTCTPPHVCSAPEYEDQDDTGDADPTPNAPHMLNRSGPADVNVAKTLGDDVALTALIKAEDDAYLSALLAKGLDGEQAMAKAHRDFTMDERRSLAKKGQALDDGSYPIPDRDALRRAVVLIKSGHGRVKEAMALAIRRAREMGIRNPFSKKGDAMAKSEGDTVTDGKYATRDEVAEIVRAQLAEALAPVTEGLAKALALPAPGGPMIAMTRPPVKAAVDRDELVEKADRYDYLAENATEPKLASDYRTLAKEVRDQVAALSG